MVGLPSKENAGMEVATRVATVTTVVRSNGSARLIWKHSRLVPESHEDVWQAPSAICVVGVVSTDARSMYWKFRPDTVTLSVVENGRLGLRLSLTTGAVLMC